MFTKIMHRIGSFLKRNLGKIGYYCAVAAVLAAVAAAAEHYRNGAADELVLPAAEIQTAVLPEGPEIILPENMALIRSYSDLPAWNENLSMWEAHPAEDYSIADGDVRCLCAGKVRSAGRSGVLGGFVEVECGELLFRYASVDPIEGIEAGREVAAGEIIASAANTMPGEQVHGVHLHLEVYENGKSISFASLAVKNRENSD